MAGPSGQLNPMRRLTTLALLTLATALAVPAASALAVSCEAQGSGVESDAECAATGVPGIGSPTVVTCWSHSYEDHYEGGCRQSGLPGGVGGTCVTVSYDGNQHHCDNLQG